MIITGGPKEKKTYKPRKKPTAKMADIVYTHQCVMCKHQIKSGINYPNCPKCGSRMKKI